jgi:multidrug efflux system outer membrane protein
MARAHRGGHRETTVRSRARIVVTFVPLVALGACTTVGPDYHRPATSVPTSFRGQAATTESLGDRAWWRLFEDETLQQLIAEALRQNNDLRVAAARILEARAQVTIARSFSFPQVNHRAGATYQRIEGDRDPIQPREEFAPSIGFDLSFELDFWGRYRRATEAARGDLLASEEARQLVVSTLVNDVAAAYLQLRSLDLESEISRRTLTARQGSLDLVTRRERGGVSGLIDVRQAEILVSQAAESIVDTQRLIEQTENAIGVLLGRHPEAVPRGRPLGQQLTVPEVPAGLPSALLERRPDVRQAEARLAAATARIGVATADFFPRVFLSGAAAGGALLIDGRWIGPQALLSLGPSLHLPLFTAGRTQAGVDSAEARAAEALAQYQQTILVAFREVADALVEHRQRREFRLQQETLTLAAADTARLADIRYKGGVSSYLEVLDSERQFFDAELGLVRSNRDELLAVVRLYRALGGGWREARTTSTDGTPVARMEP